VNKLPKFSPVTLVAKKNIKALRISSGHKMIAGAKLLGVTVKQLEDIETTKDYGCHIDLEILAKVSAVYYASINILLGDLPTNPYDPHYRRARVRVGSGASKKSVSKL